MKPNDTEHVVRNVMQTPHTLDANHRQRLEERLIARFAARYPKKEARMLPLALKPALLTVIAVAGLGFASQAPTDLPVEVGKSVDIVFSGNAPDVPAQLDPSAIADKLAATPRHGRSSFEVRAEMHRTADGPTTLHLELWGDTVPADQIERALRTSLPALANATIKVGGLEGRVRTTFMGLISAKVFAQARTPEEIEAARQQLIAQLRARGEKGNIDVQVEGTSQSRQVKVRVERKDQDPKPE